MKKFLCGSALLFNLPVVFASGGIVTAGYAFNNPAELHFIEHNKFESVLNQQNTKVEFEGTSSFAGLLNNSGSTHNRKPNSFMPDARVSSRWNDKWVTSVTVANSFDILSNYSKTGPLRYDATRTKVHAVNLATNVAYQVNPRLTVASGAIIQFLRSNFDSMVPTVGDDISFQNEGTSTGYGVDFGLLYQPFDYTYLGLAYYSRVSHEVHGKSQLGSLATNNDYNLKTALPSSITGSVMQALSPQWLVGAQVTYTNWSELKALRLNETAIGQTVVLPMNYSDSFTYDIGAQYMHNRYWDFNLGFEIDESPSTTADRTVRLPDGKSYTVMFGAQFHPTRKTTVGLNYMRAFVDTVKINSDSNGTATAGDAEVAGQIVGLNFAVEF